ncbi:hypothetical protein [Enterococcus olivae]
MMLNHLDTFSTIVVAGIFVTSLLLLIAFLLRLTKGLFLARLPEQFKKDRYDPRFAKERNAGQRFSALVFRYVPPFFVAFALLQLLLFIFK